MRPLHLLGMMAPEYRFFSPDDAPLMLPGSIPLKDHEILLAFYQQVISEKPLPRVEIDWYSMLLEPSRRFLEFTLNERGPSGVIVVVKVRRQGVDLREIVEHPMIKVFRYVAISNVHPGSGTEELRALLALTHDVRQRARERYEEMAEKLSLTTDGLDLVNEFVRNLENPIDVVEAVNGFLEVQLSEQLPETTQDVVLARVLTRQLQWRSVGEFWTILGLALKGLEKTKALLGEDVLPILAGLEVQGLLRGGELRQWAMFLDARSINHIISPPSRLPTNDQRAEKWVRRVQRLFDWTDSDVRAVVAYPRESVTG